MSSGYLRHTADPAPFLDSKGVRGEISSGGEALLPFRVLSVESS